MQFLQVEYEPPIRAKHASALTSAAAAMHTAAHPATTAAQAAQSSALQP